MGLAVNKSQLQDLLEKNRDTIGRVPTKQYPLNGYGSGLQWNILSRGILRQLALRREFAGDHFDHRAIGCPIIEQLALVVTRHDTPVSIRRTHSATAQISTVG